jgi:phage N-6-adenine-methyltransferase
MANDLWRTPPEVIEYIEGKFGKIAIDLCASDGGYITDRYLTQDDNFLTTDPEDVHLDPHSFAYCNPPYSNPLPFVNQCISWAQQGIGVVMLLNLDTSTKWFRRIMEAASIVYPIVGARIAFLNQQSEPIKGNNKPQVMVYFEPYGRTQPIQTEYVPIEAIYS